MSNGIKDGPFNRVGVAIPCLVFDTCKGSWNDEKAGEQNPGEKGGEDVVQSRYGIQVEEHAHVTGLNGGHARENLRPRWGGSCRSMRFHIRTDSWADVFRGNRLKRKRQFVQAC